MPDMSLCQPLASGASKSTLSAVTSPCVERGGGERAVEAGPMASLNPMAWPTGYEQKLLSPSVGTPRQSFLTPGFSDPIFLPRSSQNCLASRNDVFFFFFPGPYTFYLLLSCQRLATKGILLFGIESESVDKHSLMEILPGSSTPCPPPPNPPPRQPPSIR